MNNISLSEYVKSCCEISRDAGQLIMQYFGGDFSTAKKEDNSPVTNADTEANALITAALQQLTPDIPIIAEEDETLGESGQRLFWLVDPLDGTRAFINGEPEFTVNIGLIQDGVPILGVIYVPPQEKLYFGDISTGAFCQIGNKKAVRIAPRTPPEDGMVVVRSKSHPSAETEAYLNTLKVKEMISGSSSIKICMVADGSADIYPRFGRTMEWDTAAGHAILSAAGGRMETPEGAPLIYGKAGFANPYFIAFGAKAA